MASATNDAIKNRIVSHGEKPASEFVIHDRNWRKHPKTQLDALRSVLAEVGWVQDVIVNERTGKLIDGHARIALAVKNKESVPYVAVDLTPEEELLILATLDPLAAMATADTERLESLLRDVSTSNPAVQSMFDDLAKDAGLDYGAEPSEVDAEPQIDKAEELREKWGVETGQLWQLGEHRLICGDCTDPAIVARVMGEEKAELLFTSPPYTDLREYSGNDLSEVHKFISAFATYATYQVINLGIIRRNSEIIPYWDEYIAEAKRAGLKLLSWNVWDKLQAGSIGNQSSMFAIEHEWLFVFGIETKKLNRTVEHSEDTTIRLKTHRKDIYGRRIRSVRQKNNSMKNSVYGQEFSAKNLPTIVQLQPELARDTTTMHPAVFPVSLPTVYLNAMTNEGDYIIEPFAGSGTTIIACERLGRKCRAIEIAPGYCAVAIQRWVDATGKSPSLLEIP